jgi:hypothetical protein
VLISVLALASCFLPEPVPTPDTPTRLVVVDAGGTYRAWTYDALNAGPRLVARAPGSRLWVLGYKDSVAELELVVGADGEVVLDPAGLPLPPPVSSTTDPPMADAEAQALLAVLRESVRVSRPCLALVERTLPLGTGVGRLVTMAVPMSEDKVLIGVNHGTTEVLVNGQREKVWSEPGYFAYVTSTTVTPQRDVLVGTTPIGFSEPDGTVWATFSSSSGVDRSLCRFPAGEVAAEHCAPTRFEGVAPPWAPIRMAGYRSAERGMELVAMNNDNGLYAWRESDAVWRLVHRDGVRNDDRCRVGIQTLALTMDGPGTGLASFPQGPLRRYRLPPSGGVAQVELDFPEREICRSAYARLDDGTEALTITRPTERLIPPSTELWLRRTPSDPWRDVAPDITTTFALSTRSLLALQGRLVVSYESLAIGVLDVSGPLRVGLPLRRCPLTIVGSDAQTLAYTGRALLVTGAHNDESGGTNNISWLWPCSTSAADCPER